VKHVSMDALEDSVVRPLIVLRIVGEAAVTWQPTIGRTGLSTDAARCYMGKARPEPS
jgi:hypothetical protein